MKKKSLLFSLLILVLIGFGVYGYVQSVFIPVQLKEIIIREALKSLDRPLSIGKISYNPFKGAVIENLTIYEKGPQKIPFISIRHASFKILLAAFLKNRQIVIPSLRIERPSIHIVRTGVQEWNFSDLLAKIKNSSPNKTSSFFLGDLAIEEASVEIADRLFDPPFSETFEKTNFHATLSVKKGIHFSLSTHGSSPDSSLRLEGTYSLISEELLTKIVAQKIKFTPHLSMLFPETKWRFSDGSIDNGQIDLSWKKRQLQIDGDFNGYMDMVILGTTPKRIRGEIAANHFKLQKQNEILDIGTTLKANNALWVVGQSFGVQGDLNAPDLKIRVAIGHVIELLGNLELKNGKIQIGIGSNKKISGDMFIDALALKYIDQDIASKANKITIQNSTFQFGDDHWLKGLATWDDAHFYNHPNKIELSGNLKIQDTDLHIENRFSLKGDFQTTPSFNAVWINKKFNLTGSGQLEKADIHFYDDRRLAGTLSVNNTDISSANSVLLIKSKFVAQQAVLRFKNQELLGDTGGDLDLTFNPRMDQVLTYQGSFDLHDALYNGISTLGPIHAVNGKMNFKNDELTSSSLKLKALGADVTLSGTLTDFNQPYIDIVANAEHVDLQLFKAFLPKTISKPHFIPEGFSSLNLIFRGPMAKYQNAQIKLSIKFKDAMLPLSPIFEDWSSPQSNSPEEKITDIAGSVEYGANVISWKNLTGTFKGQSYSLNGRLSNFNQPMIENHLTAPEIDISTRLAILPLALSISSLQGTFYNSSIDMDGTITFQSPVPPLLDLKGRIVMDLLGLRRMLPQWKEKFDAMNPTGQMTIQATYRGDLPEWRKAIFTFSGRTPRLSLFNYVFQDTYFKLEQPGKYLTRLSFSATPYEGKLNGKAVFHFNQENDPLALWAKLTNVNLAQLRKDMPWKNQDIAGNLAFDLDLQGFLQKFDQMQGNGSFSIQNGNVWQFKLLKGIWGSLLLTPEFENIVFTDAQSTFQIHHQRIQTNNFVMQGQPVDLLGGGWISFDRKIHFVVRPNFKESEIIRSPSLKQIPTAILTQLVQDNVAIKITGSLDQPTYEKTILPMKVLEKTTSGILEGLQGILEGVLE